MNIAFFMIPKAKVKFVYSDCTVRQALETLHHSGFTAIPVLDRDGKYNGILSEGHLLWHVIKGEGGEPHTTEIEKLEKLSLSDDAYLKAEDEMGTPVTILSSIEDLIMRAMNVNFVPIVDDREVFVGIVPRSAIIRHFYYKNIDKNIDKGGDT